jgi:sterol desaturase/sphingolipid hydroxylase (fatty acid hydroxylase superfamily)
MQTIIDYFTTIPSAHRSGFLIAGIALFMLIESGIPLFKTNYNRLTHTGTNLFFTLTTIIINFVLAFIFFKTSEWSINNGIGVLNWLPQMPLWLYMIVGLLILDFIGAYLAHLISHKVKWLWRFHLIHHTDQHVDTTTANRHHPGESIFRFFCTTLGILIAGAPAWVIMLYQSASLIQSQFEHANISLPRWLDTAMSWILISPNMHKVHHHYILPYTDSNYGNIFSIWDRIFGTFMTLEPDKIIYGIDTHPTKEETTHIGKMLSIPFEGYRPPVGSKFEK